MSNRLGHRFTTKESLIIALLALALIGMCFYRFIYKPTQEEIDSYDTTELEEEYEQQQLIATRIKQMRDEMSEEDEVTDSRISVYSNQKNELNALNDILASATDFKVSFEAPTAEGDLVRRNARITFYAASYYTAEEIIKDINNCDYLCIIRDMTIQPSVGYSNTTLDNGTVQASLNVVFYETLYGASDEYGIED